MIERPIKISQSYFARKNSAGLWTVSARQDFLFSENLSYRKDNPSFFSFLISFFPLSVSRFSFRWKLRFPS